uniref:Uncharacterized protein n=1 Tax=Rhizophora mucronata TaxID=61149 RepID=A0A2P2Q5C3_RHIMU
MKVKVIGWVIQRTGRAVTVGDYFDVWIDTFYVFIELEVISSVILLATVLISNSNIS